MDKLIEVLSIQSVSGNQTKMREYIVKEIHRITGQKALINNGNVYIQKGNAKVYPCIVAHMDTVHPITSDLTIVQAEGMLFGYNQLQNSLTGCGGDDKVGIYIALQMLEHFDNIKCAFFEDEEIGCVGSAKALMKFFDDCSFVLQCDRRGKSDFITSTFSETLSGKEFQSDVLPIISKYGYKFEEGFMTDVEMLKSRKLGICAANMSCGYYNPHCSNEYVVIEDVERCKSMVTDLFTELGETIYPHTSESRYMQHADDWKQNWYWDSKKNAWTKKKDKKRHKRSWMSDEKPVPKLGDGKYGICIDCLCTNATTSEGFCDDCYMYYARKTKSSDSTDLVPDLNQSPGVEDKPIYAD